jgi:tetratricopeptide (TPR) repeat protein
MNTQDQTSSGLPLPPAPYVGMRPFEKTEQAIFFGRDRDAAHLRDKVFSSRLTVLYGTSGVGKSSILRALLIPYLEDEEARVIYFKDWSGDNPIKTLQAELIKEANKLGIPDPGAGNPTLAELVRLLIMADRKTVVLILDQFEEFFTHGHPPEALRQELGALVRLPDLDVRVLLSLREEHLASLEPLKAEVLNLFQSTSRLEPLTPDNVQEAIEEPVKRFGAVYNADLMKKLKSDLRPDQQKDGPGQRPDAGEAPVDLPMLQLVCDELWKVVKRREQAQEPEQAKEREPKIKITLGIYQELGERRGIQAAYLRRVMPRRGRDQRVTARLMENLAPPDEHKIAFSASHLAKLTKIKPARVQAELQRLSDPEVRILDSREYEKGRVLYELRHDSLIRLIAPWRDKILWWARLRRGLAGAAGALAGIALVAGLVLFWQDWRDLQEHTSKIMAELDHSSELKVGDVASRKKNEKADRSPAQKFHDVASYFLWTRSRFHPCDIFVNRFDRLRKLLKDNQAKLPPNYGIERSGIEYVTLPDPEDSGWPLTLQYSSLRNLDEKHFTLTWQIVAKAFQQKLGIPVPLKLRLIKEEGYPDWKIRFSGHDIEPLELRIHTYEAYALIDSKDLSKPGREFLERFKDEWRPCPELKLWGDYWVVPRWSLPAWRASGPKAIDGSGYPALYFLIKLASQPDRLLTSDAVEILLQKVAKRYPDTVAEARAVRGQRLRRDLQEIILRERYAMTMLPAILNILSNYPDDPSSKIAAQVISDLESHQAVLPRKIRGAHASSPPPSQADSASSARPKADPQANIESAKWLPNMQPMIRVYFGKDFESMWFTPQYKLKPELRECLEKIRDRLMGRFGISMPRVEFRDCTWDPEIPANAFRIEVLNQGKKHPLAARIRVGKDKSLDRLSSALVFRMEVNRIHFLSAEDVNHELKNLKPGVQSWLRTRYSLTDLKLLLGAVLNPSKQELLHLALALKAKTPEEAFQVPPEQSICHPDWLLASLVFWSQVPDSQSPINMVNDLRKTQSARLLVKPASLENQDIANIIEAGVQALNQGDVLQAEKAFDRAVKSNQVAAISSFLAIYPQELRPSSLMRSRIDSFHQFITSYFTDSPRVWELKQILTRAFDLGELILSRTKRVELENLVTGKDFDDNVDVASARRLRLCLLASYPESYPQAQRNLAADIVKRYGNPDQWPPEEAAWFGTQLLTWYNPITDDRSIPQTAMVFLRSALPRLTPAKALRQNRRILKVATRPGPNQWCRNLLPDLANIRKEPESMLEIASRLTSRDVPTDIQHALALATQVKKELIDHPLSKEKQAPMLAWADYVRAVAILRLSEVGAGDGTGEAETTLLKLADFQISWPGPDIELARLKRMQGRFDEAMAYLDAAMKKLPKNRDPDAPSADEINIYWQRLSVGLESGKKEAVQQVAKEALSKVKRTKKGKVTEATSDFAFVAALGMLLTHAEGWEQVSLEFLQTDHQYVPYVAMMLYSRLGGKGQTGPLRIIQARWARAKHNWKMRLSQGDQTAWREMLIGYYLEKVPRERIFANLEDKARFANSELKGVMPLRGMRCEAYFYEALLAGTKGDKIRMNSSLQKAVDTNSRGYFEYAMAKFLLAQQKKDAK